MVQNGTFKIRFYTIRFGGCYKRAQQQPGLNPEECLIYVLENIAGSPDKRHEELLPQNYKNRSNDLMTAYSAFSQSPERCGSLEAYDYLHRNFVFLYGGGRHLSTRNAGFNSVGSSRDMLPTESFLSRMHGNQRCLLFQVRASETRPKAKPSPVYAHKERKHINEPNQRGTTLDS